MAMGKRRTEQRAKAQAAKSARMSKPGGKSKYALKIGRRKAAKAAEATA